MNHEFIPRASSMGALLTQNRKVNLTDKQVDELKELSNKVKLTDKQADRLMELRAKRDAVPELSETAKSEVQKYVLLNKYGIEQNVHTWQMEKGTINEPIGLEMAAKVYGWLDVQKIQKERVTNGWVTGEADVVTDYLLADIKCSADGTTFPWFKEKPDAGYVAQLQCYMWLYNRTESLLVYALTNTPEHLIYDLKTREYYRMCARPEFAHLSTDELEMLAEDKVRKAHTFDHIPIEKRLKSYVIEFDNNYVQRIKQAVTMARAYYDEIYDQI